MSLMKKTFAALLSVILILSLAGCGKEPPAGKISASITPDQGRFGVQEGNYKDLEFTLDPGSYTLVEIVIENDMVGPDGKPFSKTLTENNGYIKNGDTYIILKEFLKTLNDYTQNCLVFKMSGGDSPVANIHIIPDESGFTIDWMLWSLSPDDAVRTELVGNKVSMTSKHSLDELIDFYEDALEYFFTAEIIPQYEADWWYPVVSGNFIYTVYLTAGEPETKIVVTFYLEDQQPK